MRLRRFWPLLAAAAFVLTSLVYTQEHPPRSGPAYSGREWTAPGGDLASTRYSTLAQIDTTNVGRLGAAWVRELPNRRSSKASPVISNGLMFVTTTGGDVIALDAASGAIAWTYKPEIAFNGNRGMGMGDGKLFAGLSDSTVIALDQRTGRLLWQKPREAGVPAQSMSSAPAYAKGVVIAVVTGGDNFARGRVMGLDAATGRQLWQFEVIPGPGEPGHETWPKDSEIWQYGGGAVWMTPSIDPDLDLVYVGTGNAVPQFAGELRPGTNLYTDSVIALDLRTGRLRWHYQLVHHDIWEHDLGAPLVLYDPTIDGRPRKALAAARTDGFIFVLDRETGRPLLPIEERPVKQDALQNTWPTQPFPVGGDRVGPPCAPRELVPEGFEAGCYFDPIRTDKPNVFMPHMNTRFAPISYSPQTGYLYETACVHPKWVRRAESPWVFIFPGRVAGVKQYGIISARDARTNKIVWQKQTPYAICAGSGTSVTAGNLLFHVSPDGNTQAYDARTGDLVWQFQTGEVGASSGNGPGGGPIAVYEIDGKQHIAVVNNRHVWAFALDGKVAARPAPEPPSIEFPWDGRIDNTAAIKLGAENVFIVRNADRREQWTDPYAITPSRTKVVTGTAVTFTNSSTLTHTIAARDGSWTTGPIPPGVSRAVTVGNPGTFEYRCTDHPWSIGQLIVAAP